MEKGSTCGSRLQASAHLDVNTKKAELIYLQLRVASRKLFWIPDSILLPNFGYRKNKEVLTQI